MSMVCRVLPMKVTFELPPVLVHRLRANVPSGDRSKFVANLIAQELAKNGNALERAARKANKLHELSREMKDWEALNGSAH